MTEYPPTSPVYGWKLLEGSAPNDWRHVDQALLDVEATVQAVDAAAGAAVTSVNGETGAVVLDAADVGAASTADLAAHAAAADPHPGYLTPAEGDALFLTPAEGNAAYAASDHTHPSEESGPWRFQDTAGGTPGAGYLRTSSGALVGATQLIISRTTQDGYDIPPPGWGLQADDTIYVQDRDDSTKWVRYVALEPLVRFPTYATGLVAETGHAGATIVNGQIVQVTFSLAGGGGGGAGGGVATDPLFDAKGDLAAGTGADAASRLAVGSNGTFLTADSAQSTGLAWAANPVTAHAALPNAHHAQAHDHTAADGSGTLTNDTHDGYSQYANLGADAATPSTNTIRLYSKDNGSGVATLYYRTENGDIYELPTLSTGGGGNGSGAPSNARYITTQAENKLSQEVILGTAVIMSGLLSARPAFGTAGRLYLATDTDLVYRDTGSAWETFATRAAGGGGGLPTTGGTMTGTIASAIPDGTGGALTVTIPGTTATVGQVFGASSPALGTFSAASVYRAGVTFSTASAGATILSVRWNRQAAGITPTAVELWDTTAPASPVWSWTTLTEFGDAAFGWKQTDIPAGSRPAALVAGRPYVFNIVFGVVTSIPRAASYSPVGSGTVTFVNNVVNTAATGIPATTSANYYLTDVILGGGVPTQPPAASGAVRLPNGTAGALAWRTAGDTADLSLTMNASDQLALAVGAGSLTTAAPSAGGAGALPATPAGYLTVVLNGTSRRMPYY